MHIVYFHRNRAAGYSINKVTQTFVRGIPDKEEFYVPYSRASLRGILGNIWFVFKHRNKYGINHVTGDIHYCILALIGCKSVLTIHDTVSLDFRKLPFLNRFLLEWFWYRLPLRFATKVVAISESTRECLKRYTRRTDIEVIHNAIDPLFESREAPAHDIPQVLLIGTSPNKNLLRTFEALKEIKCKVNIIGELSADQLASLKENHIQYSNQVGLSDAEIVDAYANSDIISFVSLFEGFGMIVVEANKVGRPIICSGIPVLKEVGGNAALFVNPEDVEDMHRGFERIVREQGLREMLIARGLENAKRFEVKEIIEKWNKLYEQV